MLRNGLGELLDREIKKASRFVDLFAGSGTVSIHIAQRFPVEVLAFDLQKFSAVLTGAIVGRQTSVQPHNIWTKWFLRANEQFDTVVLLPTQRNTKSSVMEARVWCSQQELLPITRSYGGHYFSPEQTVWIDALRSTLPTREPLKTVALAALIEASSKCVAAPGHTAQPFQPTPTAKRYIFDAWKKDIVALTKIAFAELCSQYAQYRGKAIVADANDAAKQLRSGDLAFIDPPYSGVHYSRFYHVLESIAQGDCGVVSGVGRYPAPELRPRSRYSLKRESFNALDDLLKSIAGCGAKAILTFPDHTCSNGLSGESVRKLVAKNFRVKELKVESIFSTLGGRKASHPNNNGRVPRQRASELILVLEPK